MTTPMPIRSPRPSRILRTTAPSTAVTARKLATTDWTTNRGSVRRATSESRKASPSTASPSR
jgi:hypothetical protein